MVDIAPVKEESSIEKGSGKATNEKGKGPIEATTRRRQTSKKYD